MPVSITQVTIIFFNQILYRSTLLVDPNFFLQDLKEREKKVMHFGSSLLGVKACSILSGCHDQRAANLVCQVHFCKLLNQSKHLGRTSLNCFKRFIPTIVFLILIWNLCNLCMYTKKNVLNWVWELRIILIYLGRFYKKNAAKVHHDFTQ